MLTQGCIHTRTQREPQATAVILRLQKSQKFASEWREKIILEFWLLRDASSGMLTLRLRILSEGKRQSPRRPNPEGENVAFSQRTRHSDDKDGLKSINPHQQRSINSKASFEKQRLNHLKCEPHPPTVPGSGQRVLALTQRSIQQDFPVHRHEFIPRNDATCRRTRRCVSWFAARGIASLYEVARGQSDTTCRNGDSVNNYIIPSLLLFLFCSSTTTLSSCLLQELSISWTDSS